MYRVNILLVDDQPANLLALESVLSDLGAALVKAGSGEEALLALDRGDFAVMLLDVRMPGMNGFETAMHVRSRSRGRTTPIIFLTAGDTTEEDVLNAYEHGAVDFLSKPFQVPVLRAKVAMFIELSVSRLKDAAEKRYRESERRVRLATEAAGLGFWRWLPSIDVMTWDNEQPYEILGLPPSASSLQASRFIESFLHPDDQKGFQDAVGACTLPGDTFHCESRFFRVGESDPRWLEMYGHAVVAPDGQSVQLVGTIADITARMRREEHLHELTGELRQANQRKNDFIATLSHELRTPLGTLNNALHLLNLASDPAVIARTREMMKRQLQQMGRLVEDLLDVRRISSGKIELRREPVDVVDLVDRAVEASRSVIDGSAHTLTVRVPAHPVMVRADQARLVQVMTNLLSNAAKYTPSGGAIEMEVQQAEHAVTIAVSDNGIGIPASALPTVFDMFVQVSRDGSLTRGGLGIGLALVRQLVELHGGTVHVASDGPNRGSTFTVTLNAEGQAVVIEQKSA